MWTQQQSLGRVCTQSTQQAAADLLPPQRGESSDMAHLLMYGF